MKRTLLLSSIYEPISFIDDRRIISLMIRGVVEEVSTWDDVLFESFGEKRLKVNRPAVLKLVHSNTRPARIPTFRRAVVFVRDDWRCQYCLKSVSIRDATIDHIFPESRGGPTSWKNCITACKTCNRRKGNKTPEEAKMILRSVPKSPTLAHLWGMKIAGTEWHESWAMFIPT